MKDFLNEDFERVALQERILIEIENLSIQQQQWEEEQRKMIKPAKVIIQYDNITKVPRVNKERVFS